ncbi:MAG: response regulator [Gemmatimonadaceae bacterium]|nr:response regulator [Gemmatimonadaceae bacterium]
MLPHILLVEDNALVIDALTMLLEETGHRVSAATTLAQAQRVMSEESPDVVLLDLTLGGEDGLSLMPSVNATRGTRPIVVALTGHDDPETHARCIAAGCRTVLVKPIAAMKLKGQLAEWLGERAAF